VFFLFLFFKFRSPRIGPSFSRTRLGKALPGFTLRQSPSLSFQERFFARISDGLLQEVPGIGWPNHAFLRPIRLLCGSSCRIFVAEVPIVRSCCFNHNVAKVYRRRTFSVSFDAPPGFPSFLPSAVAHLPPSSTYLFFFFSMWGAVVFPETFPRFLSSSPAPHPRLERFYSLPYMVGDSLPPRYPPSFPCGLHRPVVLVKVPSGRSASQSGRCQHTGICPPRPLADPPPPPLFVASR